MRVTSLFLSNRSSELSRSTKSRFFSANVELKSSENKSKKYIDFVNKVGRYLVFCKNNSSNECFTGGGLSMLSKKQQGTSARFLSYFIDNGIGVFKLFNYDAKHFIARIVNFKPGCYNRSRLNCGIIVLTTV